MFENNKIKKELKRMQKEKEQLRKLIEQHPELAIPDYISIEKCYDIIGTTYNRYNEEEILYLLDSLKIVDMEGYSIFDAETIGKDKSTLLGTSDFERNYLFDVTKIYLLLNSKEAKRPTDIYQEFIRNYRNAFSDPMYQENRKKYSILLNTIESNEKLLKEMNQTQREKFLKLGPKNMSFVRKYFGERYSLDKQIDKKEAICDFLEPLTISQIETLSDFSEKKFRDLLSHYTPGSYFHSLLFSLYNKDFIQDESASIPYEQIYNAMQYFPEHFLIRLGKNSYYNQENFINYIKDLKEPELKVYKHSLDAIPEKYKRRVEQDIIENEDFRRLTPDKMEMIFMELFSTYQNNNNICYLECFEFLIPFALEVSPNVLDITKTFLCHETDKEILEAKIKAVENVGKDIEMDNPNIDVTENCYALYIELLQQTDRNPKKQQLKQLRARSSYFEDHKLETIFADKNLSRFNELLNSDTGKKHHTQSYLFIENANQYRNGVVDIIIEHLENVPSGKTAKQIMEYINQDQFIDASYEEQLEQLKKLPGQRVSIKQDDITVDICDINSLPSNNEEMIFTNKETGAKVKVKNTSPKK